MPAITGTITVEGRPRGGTYVRLTGPSGEFVSEQYTKDDGRFTFHVAAGAWTIEARAAGAQGETHTVRVDQADATADIELKPAG